MLQNDVFVLDRNQQIAISAQSANLLLQFFDIINRTFEDGSLVNSAIFTADVTAGTFDIAWQKRT